MNKKHICIQCSIQRWVPEINNKKKDKWKGIHVRKREPKYKADVEIKKYDWDLSYNRIEKNIKTNHGERTA